MREYNSNYLGLVINNNDPLYRGRVQVFIPHIMPALYDGWNKEGKDIHITCVGDNIAEGLTSDIVAKLVKILPWAEAASPIIGSSSPGGVLSNIYEGVKGAVTAVGNAAVGLLCDQSPTAAPVQIEGGNAQDLINKAKDITGLAYDGAKWGKCARGTTGLDKAAGLIDNNGAAAGFEAASSIAAGGTNRTGYNPYTTGKGAENFLKPFTVDPATYKPQLGDSVYAGGGSAGNGHAQKVIGFKEGKAIWASDNPQSKFFEGGKSGPKYNNFTVYRLNDAGLAKYKAAIGADGTSVDVNPKGSETSSSSMYPAAPSPHQTPTGGDALAQAPMTLSGNLSGASEGGTASETGVSKEALEYAMRVAAAESGAGIQSSSAVLAEISDPLLALGYSYNSYVPKSEKISWTGSRSYDEVRALGKQVISKPGFNANSMDVGYTQNNNNDVARHGLKNSGSYREQVLSLAVHVQKQMDNPNKASFAAALRRGDFPGADKMNTVPGWDITAENVNPGKYKRYTDAKAGLSSKINSQFGGDPFAALNAIDGENPATSSANEMLGTNYAMPAAGSGQSYAGGPAAPNLVNNTDGHGPTVVKNTNDMPKGMFAFPNVGAMVWVFFREGNPLYPVYFAASYSSDEWKAAMNGSSKNGPGTNTGTTETQIANRTNIHPNAGGGMEFAHIRETTDPTGSSDTAYAMMFGDDGSNMMFAKGYHQIYTRHTRRDQIDGDAFRIVGGYEEKWITADSNTNVRGNVSIKIGKFDAESLAALQKLATMSADANSMLAQPTTSQNKGEAPKTQAAKEAATDAQQAAAGASQVSSAQAEHDSILQKRDAASAKFRESLNSFQTADAFGRKQDERIMTEENEKVREYSLQLSDLRNKSKQSGEKLIY